MKVKLTKKQMASTEKWFKASEYLPWTDNRNESDCLLVTHLYSTEPVVAYYNGNNKKWLVYFPFGPEIHPIYFRSLPKTPQINGQ